MKDFDVWDRFEKTIADALPRTAEDAGKDLARIATDALVREFGGVRIGYLPRLRRAREQEILDALRRMPTSEVADRYGLSRSTIYRKIRLSKIR